VRILIATRELPPNPHGGIGSFYEDYAARLADLGHRVIVVAPGKAAPAGHLEARGVAVVRVQVAGPVGARWYPSLAWRRSAAASSAAVASLPADYEIAESANTEGAALGLRRALPPEVPLIVRIHGFVSTPPVDLQHIAQVRDLLGRGVPARRRLAGDLFARWRALTSERVEAAPLRDADLVIAPSQFMARYAAARYGLASSSIRVVTNGVDTRRIRLAISGRRPPLAALPLDGRPYVVFAGRVSRSKGVHLLVDAAGSLFRAGSPARIVIAGRSVDPALLAAVPANVVVAGSLEREDLWRLISGAVALAHPSLYEVSPMILAEALACGTPVIAFATGPMPEMIRDRIDGRIVPLGDTEALAQAIAELSGDPHLRARMGRAAGEDAEERFGITRATAQSLDVYESVLASR